MAQTAAWHPNPLTLPSSASSERRSEFGMNIDTQHPRASWEIAEILSPTNPGASHYSANRDRKMSMDFPSSASSQPHNGLYGQPDLEQSFGLHTPDSSSPQHQLNGSIQSHPFEQGESVDSSEHSGNYDSLFSNGPPGSSFTSSRYRTNASSSSSIGQYGEGLYSHSSFGDSVPSFSNGNNNPYEIIHNISSSYSSGKVSPLTPNDSVGSLHHSPAFPPSVGSKDFPHGFPELITDRRLSNSSGGNYPSDYPDEYMGNLNNGLPFPSVQNYPDRLSRFQGDRFPHSGPAPTVGSHVSHHNGDILRSVAPHATHSFRPDQGYDDMSHHMGQNPHADLSLRMPSVDETLARMRLQGHPIMGASNDLQTFIR